MLDPVAAYDRIGPVFARIAEKRRAYPDSIDRLVISAIPPGSRSMLDVGSGDGRRARRIAEARNIAELVLVEPSVAMQGTLDNPDPTVRTMRAEELHLVDAEFDVITCLWNVLGHVFPSASRWEVLRQFARLVSPQGRIFVDLQHRYNVRHYGAIPTALRYLRDRVSWKETNGDVVVAWDACTTRGHVFTHREFRSLVQAAGLNIETRFVVDYATGECRRWSIEGHLLYVLGRTAARSVQQTS